MASTSRVFTGCRALFAAAKAAAPKSAEAAPAATAKPTKAKATKAKATTTTAKPKVRKASTTPGTYGILKVVPVSPALGEFVGTPEVSRTIAVKKIWEHIKSNNLQSPEDKKIIHCDAKLKTIFDGKDQVGFLEIAGLLSRHFVKADK